MDSAKDDTKAEPICYDGSVLEGSQTKYESDNAYLKSFGKMAELHRVYNFWTRGQQFYVQKLATEKFIPFLSYFVGWCLLLAETATGSSCALNTANIITTMVYIFHPDVPWKSYQTFLVYLGLLVIPFLLNLKPSALPVYSTVGAVFTILGFFGWAIPLL
ncbi:choline permease, partial [Fusarium mundagurra]